MDEYFYIYNINDSNSYELYPFSILNYIMHLNKLSHNNLMQSELEKKYTGIC